MIKILSEEARIILMQFYFRCDGNQLGFRKSPKSMTRISLQLIWKYERWPRQYCKAARYLIMRPESGKIATSWLLSAAQISRRIEIKLLSPRLIAFLLNQSKASDEEHTRLELSTNICEVSHYDKWGYKQGKQMWPLSAKIITDWIISLIVLIVKALAGVGVFNKKKALLRTEKLLECSLTALRGTHTAASSAWLTQHILLMDW